MFAKLVEEALRKRGRVNVLIAGKTGVGKSTLITSIVPIWSRVVALLVEDAELHEITPDFGRRLAFHHGHRILKPFVGEIARIRSGGPLGRRLFCRYRSAFAKWLGRRHGYLIQRGLK
ncbi:MAG TPA: hypothetical protein DIT64_15765 [Verrucomicrobiales bacterium]|nr:hypothetical protein [Verrucomicrobiales bacterium]